MAAYERLQPASRTSTIIKADKKRGCWEAVPVALINDRRLELDTLGLAVWLMARSDGWEICTGALPRLLKSTTTGKPFAREKTSRMLRELKNAGYLTRTRTRDRNGRWLWHTVFSAIDGFAVDGSAMSGETVDGKPVDNSQTLITPNGFTTNSLQFRDEPKTKERAGLARKQKRDTSGPAPASMIVNRIVDTLNRISKASAE